VAQQRVIGGQGGEIVAPGVAVALGVLDARVGGVYVAVPILVVYGVDALVEGLAVAAEVPGQAVVGR
jgi:hypothetical protein